MRIWKRAENRDPCPLPSEIIANIPGDQVQKVESVDHVQKPLRFAYKMKRDSEEIPKRRSNTLEIIGSNERESQLSIL